MPGPSPRSLITHTQDDVEYLRKHKVAHLLDSITCQLLDKKPNDPEKLFDEFRNVMTDRCASMNEAELSELKRSKVFEEWRERNLRALESAVPDEEAVKIVTTDSGMQYRRVAGFVTLYGKADAIAFNKTSWMDSAAKEAWGFDPSYPLKTRDGRQFSLQNEVPWQFRLASLFLHKIGRDRRSEQVVKDSKGHYDYSNDNEETNAKLPGLPKVRLLDRLSQLHQGSTHITVSAGNLQKYFLEKYGKAEWDRLQGYQGRKDMNGDPSEQRLTFHSLEDLYGAEEFNISISEVQELERSTRIFTGSMLPASFWLRVANITSRDDVLQYYHDRKALPLRWFMGDDALECQLGAFIRTLEESEEERAKYQFEDKESFDLTILLSLTELSTQVVISQKGYFMTGEGNRVAQKAVAPLTFLSAPGIDFNAGAAARTEMTKYFTTKDFIPGGREALLARVKQTYNLIFLANQKQGVTHPTAIAMGLGVFLPSFPDDDACDRLQSDVKKLYHQAQFELLEENDYGFDTYWLNPGPGTRQAMGLIIEKNWQFKCKVAIHHRDGKGMAISLAKHGLPTSFLNPSDCIAVMQGVMGYWWEVGMGERYVGEEDFAATGTGVLARSNICSIWSAYDDNRVEEELQRVIHVGGQSTAELKMLVSDGIQKTGYPRPVKARSNPHPEEFPNGFEYKWTRHHDDGESVEKLCIKRIIWAGLKKHQMIHLRPIHNLLREKGIIVDVVHGTLECLEALVKPGVPPATFILTDLFTCEMVGGRKDSGHRLVSHCSALRTKYHLPVRIMVASMRSISSAERSTLYSEGANHVAFNMHIRHISEILDAMAACQWESNCLCDAVRCNSVFGKPEVFESEEEENLKSMANVALDSSGEHYLIWEQEKDDPRPGMVRTLISMGVDRNFAPKAWGPLHYAAADKRPGAINIINQLINANAEIETRTRMSCHNLFKGSTPLAIAAKFLNIEAVKILLQHGASPLTEPCADADEGSNVNAENSPLMIAKAMVTLMEKIKADLQTDDGFTEEDLPTFCRTKDRGMDQAKGVDASHLVQIAKDILVLMEGKTSVPAATTAIRAIKGGGCPLTVLWISTSSEVSRRTQVIRNKIDSLGAVTVQTLSCFENQYNIDVWLENTINAFLLNAGSNRHGWSRQDKFPLHWLQTVVIELRNPKRLGIWAKLLKHIRTYIFQKLEAAMTDEEKDKLVEKKKRWHPKSTREDLDWTDYAPWLKIITYAEGFNSRRFKDQDMKKELYLLKPGSSRGRGGEHCFGKDSVILNSALPWGEILVAAGAPKGTAANWQITDPTDAKCADGLKQLHEELQNAILHWAWDGEDSDHSYPDRAYNALVSFEIEQAYRDGAPSYYMGTRCLYYKDMVQRVIEEPMRMRLVFRYPSPCFDADSVVKGNTHLLNEMVEGNCMLFVGAGFCIPAGGPSWADLLIQVANTAVEEDKKEKAEKEKLDAMDSSRGEAPTPSAMLAPPVKRRQSSIHTGRSVAVSAISMKKTAHDFVALEAEIKALVSKPGDHSNFELAAQLLEDALEDKMQRYLARNLNKSVKRGVKLLQEEEQNPVMCSRLRYLRCIPICAILTTNYSRELCYCGAQTGPSKDDVVVDGKCLICEPMVPLPAATEAEEADSHPEEANSNPTEAQELEALQDAQADEEKKAKDLQEPPYVDIMRAKKLPKFYQRPVIQIHGSVCKPKSIVLSREGYRKLLHDRPNYKDFLKSAMMNRTILYVGFSFTDDYLNEIRSDVMAMKPAETLAYAIIPGKDKSLCEYYRDHEGVKIMTWNASKYGFGVMDRYTDALLRMTDIAAALSGAKLVLFSPQSELSSSGSSDRMMRMRLFLEQSHRESPVFGQMKEDYFQKFRIINASSLSEVETTLKIEDFLQPWVVIFAEDGLETIPPLHRELIEFLWHPHARLKTTMYPPSLIVWGSPDHLEPPKNHPDELPLKQQYEANLHVNFCTELEEIRSHLLQTPQPQARDKNKQNTGDKAPPSEYGGLNEEAALMKDEKIKHEEGWWWKGENEEPTN